MQCSRGDFRIELNFFSLDKLCLDRNPFCPLLKDKCHTVSEVRLACPGTCSLCQGQSGCWRLNVYVRVHASITLTLSNTYVYIFQKRCLFVFYLSLAVIIFYANRNKLYASLYLKKTTKSLYWLLFDCFVFNWDLILSLFHLKFSPV